MTTAQSEMNKYLTELHNSPPATGLALALLLCYICIIFIINSYNY